MQYLYQETQIFELLSYLVLQFSHQHLIFGFLRKSFAKEVVS